MNCKRKGRSLGPMADPTSETGSHHLLTLSLMVDSPPNYESALIERTPQLRPRLINTFALSPDPDRQARQTGAKQQQRRRLRHDCTHIAADLTRRIPLGVNVEVDGALLQAADQCRGLRAGERERRGEGAARGHRRGEERDDHRAGGQAAVNVCGHGTGGQARPVQGHFQLIGAWVKDGRRRPRGIEPRWNRWGGDFLRGKQDR